MALSKDKIEHLKFLAEELARMSEELTNVLGVGEGEEEDTESEPEEENKFPSGPTDQKEGRKEAKKTKLILGFLKKK